MEGVSSVRGDAVTSSGQEITLHLQFPCNSVVVFLRDKKERLVKEQVFIAPIMYTILNVTING